MCVKEIEEMMLTWVKWLEFSPFKIFLCGKIIEGGKKE